MNIERTGHKVAKAQSDKEKEKNSVPLCLRAFVPDKKGFTLMELLVVIAIIGMLAAILTPTLNIARERGRRAVCIGNLKVIGEAFNMYNIDIGEIPPTRVSFNWADHRIQLFFSATRPEERIGLGYFYDDPSSTSTKDDYIEDFATFVCPSSNYARDPKKLKQDWNNSAVNNVFSAYIYRSKSYPGPLPTPPLVNRDPTTLADSGPSIVMDYNCDPSQEYNHKGEYVNILFRNGNVKGVQNPPDPSALANTLALQNCALPPSMLAIVRIERVRIFLLADEQQ